MSWRKSLFGRTASRTPSSTIDKNKVREEDAVEAVYSECWGTLCTDILLEILKRVEAGTDSRWNILSCAGVCRRWRDVSREMMVGLGRISVPGNFTFPSCLKQPGPLNHPHQFLFIRDKKNSTFYLYLALNASFTDKGKFFLAAKRCRDGAHTEYIISIDANDISQGSNAYVGKLRSDFMGTSFTIYDSQPPLNGEGHSNNKSNRRVASKQISPQVPKGNFKVGQVSYKLNLLKSKGPRRMVCAVNYPWSDKHTSHQLKENFQGRKHETSSNSCTILSNRTPRWHEQLQCWCLNFHGRATVASVKNFQLVARVDQSQPKGKGDEEIVLLQFGKVAGDTFTLDYRQPLSAFQAFAICLTSFGTKLACE